MASIFQQLENTLIQSKAALKFRFILFKQIISVNLPSYAIHLTVLPGLLLTDLPLFSSIHHDPFATLLPLIHVLLIKLLTNLRPFSSQPPTGRGCSIKLLRLEFYRSELSHHWLKSEAYLDLESKQTTRNTL